MDLLLCQELIVRLLEFLPELLQLTLVSLFDLPHSLLLPGPIYPIHLEEHFLNTILAKVVMLHLEPEQQSVALSWRPHKLLRHPTRAAAATLLPANVRYTQMPELDLLYNMLQVVQPLAVIES
jgi:hypothetical protein